MSYSALTLKDQGNKAFADGRFEEADALYTRAIQRDPTDPVFFTNRAFARIKLEAWEGCLSDCLKAIDLFRPDDKPTRIKMKAYYYLAQAQLGLKRPGEALSSAHRAYEMCLALESSSAQQISSLVLRAKKDKWFIAEGDRLRRKSQLLREVENGLRLAREHDEKALEDRVDFARNNECDNMDADEVEEERSVIRENWERQIREVRDTFALSDPENLGRREVPDYLIDNITFAVMHDPVVTKHGHSYERSTIEAHLRTSQTDPLTRDPLTPNDLRPNLSLKEAATQFLEENGWAVDW